MKINFFPLKSEVQFKMSEKNRNTLSDKTISDFHFLFFISGQRTVPNISSFFVQHSINKENKNILQYVEHHHFVEQQQFSFHNLLLLRMSRDKLSHNVSPVENKK